MKKKVLLAFGLILVVSQFAFARGPKDKLATPTIEDQANAVSIYTTVVGTAVAQKIYAPNQDRDTRLVTIANPSSRSIMHVSTWAINTALMPVNSTVTTPLTWAIPVSTFLPGGGLSLNAKATFYALFEVGNGSVVVRALELWDDPSLRP